VKRTLALPLISSSFSSLIFACLPKCPACLVLLLAPLGIKVPGSTGFLVYAILMLAGIPLAFFWTPACRKCGIRPLLLALTGLAIMTIGRIAAESLAVMAAGAIAMFGAALWAARPSMGAARTNSVGRTMQCESKLS
jgi:hypothetical protein